MRRVLIGEEAWGYHIGRGSAVIQSPKTGKKTIVYLTRLTGRDVNTFERGQYKGTSDGMVTPAHVRNFILAHGEELHRGSLDPVP